MINSKSEIIILTEELFYGTGRHKKCYLHPIEENLCIKIAYNRGDKQICSVR